jgi:hypothetical protein
MQLRSRRSVRDRVWQTSGAKTFLVRTGYGAQWEREGVRADHIVADVLEAAQAFATRRADDKKRYITDR